MKNLSTTLVHRELSPTTIQRLQRRLEAERTTALRRAAGLRAGAEAALDDIDVSDLLDDQDHDGFVGGVEHEGLLRLAQDAERSAARARMALERLRDRTYGVCTACERNIPLVRLEALPTTEVCVTCASRMTRLLGRSVA